MRAFIRVTAWLIQLHHTRSYLKCVAFDLPLVHLSFHYSRAAAVWTAGSARLDKGSALSKRLMASFRPSGVARCSKMSTTSKLDKVDTAASKWFLGYRMRRHTRKHLHVIIRHFLVDLLGEGPHSLSRVERRRSL